MKSALKLIAAERARQTELHRWDAAHDDEHDSGELALAAALYATPSLLYAMRHSANATSFVDPWPWDERFDKRPMNGNVLQPNGELRHHDRVRQLAKAGALIVAEIERLQRLYRKASQ